MLTFEIVSKKRRPVKLYAIYGMLFGVLLLISVAIFGHSMTSSLAKFIMGISALIFVICLFILNYSYKFKNSIGFISFSTEFIEIEILGKKELIRLDSIVKINFKLVGYEGLNTSGFSDFLIVPLFSLFSYHSGINNFVLIKTPDQTRKFEFYIPDENHWINLKSMVQYYRGK
jgi:hypothetical protein